MPPERRPSEPWFSFLTELDGWLGASTDFHCIGGFAVSQGYGLGRETADLDVLAVLPGSAVPAMLAYAGEGGLLHRKHGVYLDVVGVANYPAEYEERLVRVFPHWQKLRLWVLEPHDLALTKLERSHDKDIQDVVFLARAGLLEKETLEARFAEELEPYLVGRTPTWNRATLRMWMEACWPEGE